MGLTLELHLPADTQFLCIGEIPSLTAQAIYPESGLAQAASQINNETLLNELIEKEEYVTPLNPLSYEPLTLPFGEALRSAVITVEDFIRYAEILRIQVMIGGKLTVSPDVTGTRAGLTIQEAAQTIAKKYRFSKSAEKTLQEQLSNAASRGELVVRDPMTGLPYSPSTRTDFWEFVSISDLNSWLEKQGVEYRLDRPEQEQYGDEPAESSQTIGDVTGLLNRNEVIAKFTVKSDPDANEKFWENRLDSPSDQLKIARKSAGKPGTSALWEPLGIAHYLLGGGRVNRHMTPKQLNEVMNKHFPELVDSWKEQTEDVR